MKWISDKGLKHLLAVANDPDFGATKYRLLEEISHGGMGTVYRALDTELNREIAIKVMRQPEAGASVAARMVREAQIIARLEHPGIVPVHDVGILADGRVFYAMKLVRGGRLDDYAARNPGIKDRLRKFQAACEAVAFAHAHGVIHRDLKPQNIMIGSFGEVLVLDWGVAKINAGHQANGNPLEIDTLPLAKGKDQAARFDRAADHETAQGTIIGTQHYMSPEQASGEVARLDERADVYALGVILYFLLTNRTPGTGGDEPLPGPREVNPKVSKAAEAVCLKAKATAAASRYANARELAQEVARLLDEEPVSAYRENALELAGRWLGRNRLLVLLVLAYLVMRIFFILTARG